MDSNHFNKELIDEPVHIVPYSFEWATDFEKEKQRLEEAMKNSVIAIEHIGSTAIPGMQAKPIIDIMIGIEHYPPPSDWINQIGSLGYSYHGEAGVPQRLYFTRRGEKNFNLAVVLFQGNHWENNLRLRNFLRTHPEECRAYETIKNQAIDSGAEQLLSYSDFKKDFIQRLFDKMNL